MKSRVLRLPRGKNASLSPSQRVSKRRLHHAFECAQDGDDELEDSEVSEQELLPSSDNDNDEKEEINTSTQKIFEDHERVLRDMEVMLAKERALVRERVLKEQQHDENPPLTQRFFSDPKHGPTRLRLTSTATDVQWREDFDNGLFDEQKLKFPPAYLKSHDTTRAVMMPSCHSCRTNTAKTVNANCGHATWCIKCSRQGWLKCAFCNGRVTHIIPLLDV